MKVNHIFHEKETTVSNLASYRVRFSNLTKELGKLGVKSSASIKPIKSAINVYHKHFNKKGPEQIKKSGGIFDITDNYFQKPERGYYIKMCRNADFVTCPTWHMAHEIFKSTRIKAYMIPDTYDDDIFKYSKPEYKDTQSVCWFGLNTNLYTLNKLALPCDIEIVSNVESRVEGFAKYTMWDTKTINKILKKHDIVVLPYTSERHQNTKSPNRIMNALYAGKIVITNSYILAKTYGLENFVVVTPEIGEGVSSVWDNPAAAIERTELGQKYIMGKYSPKAVAKEWKELFECAIKQR